MDPSQRAALRMVINDLVRERDNLNVTIATLNARLGPNGSADGPVPLPAFSAQISMNPRNLPDEAIVNPGELVGMTSRDAAIRVLHKSDRPLTVQELHRLLLRGGVPLNGVHAVNTLRRALDGDPRFVRASSRHWEVMADAAEPEPEPRGGSA